MARRGRPRARRRPDDRLAFLFLLLVASVLLSAAASLNTSSTTASTSSTSSYNEALARRMIVYSSIAISEPEQVAAWSFPNPLCNQVIRDDRLVQTYRARDTAFGYVVRNDADRYLLAAFKGSNDTLDWIEHDLRSSPFHYHRPCTVDRATGATLPGRVHHGLCTYYADLVELGMADALAGLARAHPDYTFYITGHSLGGAAAALCASDMLHRFRVPSVLYTFGEPRVGDHDFARILTKGSPGRAFRVVHNHDLVPHLGTCCGREMGDISCLPLPGCPYHHQTEVFYVSHMILPNRYTVCTDEEDPSCSNALRDVEFSVREHKRYFGVDVSALCRWAPPVLNPPNHQSSAAFWEGLAAVTARV